MEEIYTVEPRYSASQGTGQNYALNQGFHYFQHRNNYENASWDQNLYAVLAEIRYKRVRYSGVSLYYPLVMTLPFVLRNECGTFCFLSSTPFYIIS